MIYLNNKKVKGLRISPFIVIVNGDTVIVMSWADIYLQIKLKNVFINKIHNYTICISFTRIYKKTYYFEKLNSNVELYELSVQRLRNQL